jgi:hypothetical protein
MIYSAPMVRALRDGIKTQTRRVIKWQGPKGYPHSFDHARIDNPAGVQRLLVPFHHPDEPTDWNDCVMHRHYGLAEPGDRLWVKEDLICETLDLGGADRCVDVVCYAEDGTPAAYNGWYAAWPWKREKLNARFMPRRFSRITLTVTEVRPQRLRDITLGDCYAEGCTVGKAEADAGALPVGWTGPWDEYRALWNSLHGPDAWERNDWVWAYSFSVHHGNIDSMKRRG